MFTWSPYAIVSMIARIKGDKQIQDAVDRQNALLRPVHLHQNKQAESLPTPAAAGVPKDLIENNFPHHFFKHFFESSNRIQAYCARSRELRSWELN